jgi:hypothetical protein
VLDDPYADPVTEVLRNKLELGTAEELAAAEREITHAALGRSGRSPSPKAARSACLSTSNPHQPTSSARYTARIFCAACNEARSSIG